MSLTITCCSNIFELRSSRSYLAVAGHTTLSGWYFPYQKK